MSLTDLVAYDSEAKKQAEDRLRKRVSVGAAQQQAAISKVMGVVIIDRLKSPAETHFDLLENQVRIGYRDTQSLTIHPHALGQIAGVMDIPRSYVSRLQHGKSWEKDLLVHNLNVLFSNGEHVDRRKNPAKFLQRIVGTELRGFLSRSYNRKLLTTPLLKAFLESCQLHGAGPIESYATDIRTTIKFVLPMVFEPVEGEFVAFGVTFTNSDYGAGRLKLSGTVMRVKTSTISVLEDKYSRTHLGSVIQESDIEMSEETASKETIAACSAVKDTVAAVLSRESIEAALKAIQVANYTELPWHKLKEQLGTLLGKQDLDLMRTMIDKGPEVMDLPAANRKEDGSPILTLWGASNLVGWFADKENDTDKKSDLQAVAGRLIKAA